MSRARILLTSAALIAGAISLSIFLPGIAHAQCANADQCTPSLCRTLQSDVHPACDQERSCRYVSVDDKIELARRLLINQQCLNARSDVSACFSRPDQGHRLAIQAAQNAINTCRTKLQQN